MMQVNFDKTSVFHKCQTMAVYFNSEELNTSLCRTNWSHFVFNGKLHQWFEDISTALCVFFSTSSQTMGRHHSQLGP